MNFNHTDDRRAIADTLSRYFDRRYPFEVRQTASASSLGYSGEQWREVAELGIIAALFDEAAGGLGGAGFDIAVVFEQIGRGLALEPFLPTLMAGSVLAAAGGFGELLETAVAGQAQLAFANEEPDSHYDLAAISMRADRQDDGWVLTGEKAVVAALGSADQIVCSARIAGKPGDTDGIGLFLVAREASGVAVRDYPLIDGGRGGELRLVDAPARLIVANGDALIEQAVAQGINALCWEAVGAMDVVKAMTAEYLRTRKQFGVPIGTFQALRHRMATVALEIEQARSAAINVADTLGAPRLERERAVSAAKFTIGRVGTIVAEEAIQLHGGIGMTWELPLSHYAKRLILIGHQLGDEDHHLARFSALGACS